MATILKPELRTGVRKPIAAAPHTSILAIVNVCSGIGQPHFTRRQYRTLKSFREGKYLIIAKYSPEMVAESAEGRVMGFVPDATQCQIRQRSNVVQQQSQCIALGGRQFRGLGRAIDADHQRSPIALEALGSMPRRLNANQSPLPDGQVGLPRVSQVVVLQ